MKHFPIYCIVLITLIFFSCKKETLLKLPPKDIWTTFSANGLADNPVYAIIEDSKDKMWFGTQGSGLYNYDGSRWNNYNTSNSDILSDWIYSLLEDNDGNIFIGTDIGISVLQGNNWYHLNTNSSINTITQLKSGDIYFGTAGDGFLVYSLQDQLFHPYSLNDTTFNYIEKIFQDSRENIWFCTTNGLVEWTATGKVAYRTSEGLASLHVRTAFEDSRGRVWFGFFGGETVQYYENSAFHTVSLDVGFPDMDILSIQQDMFGNYWFGSILDGAIRYNGSMMAPVTKQDGLADNTLLAICRDHNNNLWFGCYYNGVSRLTQSVQ